MLAPGFLTTPSAAELLGGREGLVYGGGLTQLGWQLVALGAIASFTFVTAWASFTLIDRTMGLRAPEEAELQGLDIVEHGMYGYPERFIEVPGATPDDALLDLEGVPVGAATAPRGMEDGS